MVASDKIEEAKNCFHNIKQSGRNNYQKYDYFELKDILPTVRSICKEFNLKTNVTTDIERNCFVLRITDKDDNTFEEFEVPYAPIGAGDAGKWMQDFGRCMTYARRYLYLEAFEIAVPDEIDGGQRSRSKSHFVPKNDEENKIKIVPKQSKDNPNVVVKDVPKKAPVKEKETVEVTKDDVKTALDRIYYLVVEEGGKEFTEAAAIYQLSRQYKDQPELIQECKNALKTYKAGEIQ